MGDRKVFRTYGRHRQRMISVDIWGDSERHEVFSISSDGQSSCSDKTSTRNAAGSRQKKTRVRAKKTTARNKTKKTFKKVSNIDEEWSGNKTSGICMNDSSPKLFDSSEWKSQNILLDHDTNRMSSPVQEKKPLKKGASQKPQAQVKRKQGISLFKEERNTKKEHNTNRCTKESSLNFSQFDSYDLLLDSSPYAGNSDSGNQKSLDSSQAGKVNFHSTPYQNLHKQSVFSLSNCKDEDDCACNLDDLSEVSGITRDENNDPSLSLNNITTRADHKIKLPLVSEDKMSRETSGNNTAASARDGGTQSDVGIFALDRSSDVFLSAQSQCGITKEPDLHSDTREYNASESMFDQSSVVGNQKCFHLMALSSVRGKASSVSLFSSRQNDLSDLLSGGESEEVCSKFNTSSDLSLMNSDSSNCSQSEVVASSTCLDLSRPETNLGHQTPARYQTPTGHYTSVMLYTPASNMTHSHCFQTGELSRDREKELTQEIYSSGQSLKVLLTPITVPTSVRLHTSGKLCTPVSQNTQGRLQTLAKRHLIGRLQTPGQLQTPGRLQTPVRRIIKNVQTPIMSAERQKQLIEEIHNSGKSLQILLSPVKSSPFSARDKVLCLCQQKKPVTFLQCIPRGIMQKCRKVGEGVYGEVFRSERNKKPIALKIIPVEGDDLVNGEQQKTFEEVLPEIIITKELSALKDTESCQTPNFVHMQRVSLVRGTFPATLLKQWDIFDATKGSENDRPDFYDGNQLFIVFEFEDCGTDLSSFEISNMQQVKSVLQQVVASLAIAEEALQFEHRDLHWGNVLLKPTKCSSFNYRLQGRPFSIESHGVKVAIIDFTLSRLCKDGCSIFTDLSTDLTLFQGVGDYQFDVYRLMKEVTGNNWEHFRPFTNLLWIKYLTDKLLNQKSCSQKIGKQSEAINKQMEELLEDILNYSDARHLLIESTFFKS